MYTLFNGNKKAKLTQESNTGLANDRNKAPTLLTLNQDKLIKQYYSGSLICISEDKFS